MRRHSANCVSMLRTAATIDGPKSICASIVRALQKLSPEFVAIWDAHEVVVGHSRTKRFRHPMVGDLALAYETFAVSGAPSQLLVVYHTEPGSPSERALALLGTMAADPAPVRD